MNVITSPRNEKVKLVKILLNRRRERYRRREFVIPFSGLFWKAISFGIEVKWLLLPERFDMDEKLLDIKRFCEDKGIQHYLVKQSLFDSIKPGDAADIFACMRFWSTFTSLPDPSKLKFPVIPVLDKIEKPGNMGAILRNADAAGISSCILTEGCVDPLNIQAIWNSKGAVFGVDWAVASFRDVISWMKQYRLQCYVATPKSHRSVYECDWQFPCVIILGREHEGVSKEWAKAYAVEEVAIPIYGRVVDSHNVAVAAGIIFYELRRSWDLKLKSTG